MLNQVILVGKISDYTPAGFWLSVDDDETLFIDYEMIEPDDRIKVGHLVGVKARLSDQENHIIVIAEKITVIESKE